MPWHDRLSKKTSGSKYYAQKTQLDGYWFASKAEAALYQELKLQMQAGAWDEVHCQVCVYLTDARIMYKPDFMTRDKDGKELYHEMKGGFETPTWRIKRKLWPYYGPGELVVYNYDHRRRMVVHKETIKLKSELKKA